MCGMMCVIIAFNPKKDTILTLRFMFHWVKWTSRLDYGFVHLFAGIILSLV